MLDQQLPIGVSPLVHMQSFRPFPVHLKLGRRYTVCVCVLVFWFKCFNNRSISRLCIFWARVHVYTVQWQNELDILLRMCWRYPHPTETEQNGLDISIVPCPVPHGHAPLASNSRWEETIPAYPTSTISSFYSHFGILEWKHAMYTCKAYANLGLQQLNKKATVDSINQ